MTESQPGETGRQLAIKTGQDSLEFIRGFDACRDDMQEKLLAEQVKKADLEAESRDWKTQMDIVLATLNYAVEKNKGKQAECYRYLVLLREYQWSARRGKHGTEKCCPCCLNFEKGRVHSSACDIGNALKDSG